MGKAKIFVLDTNVILHDHKAIFHFQENNLVIPVAVIEEADKFKKGSNPFLICTTTNCRSTYFKAFINFFYSPGRNIIKLKIFFHISILPEARKIRFIPHFNRPGNNFISPIAFHKVL